MKEAFSNLCLLFKQLVNIYDIQDGLMSYHWSLDDGVDEAYYCRLLVQ
jgi:hypothetical protein